MKPAIVVVLLLSAIFSVAQQLPVGTLLPVALGTTIDADNVRAGQRISAALGQYIETDGRRLPRRTQVNGHIVQAQPGSASSPSRVTLVFDSIRIAGRDVPITTSLRAMASMHAVFDAQLPTNLVNDYGSSIRDWNTLQVGGQAVYRGDGTVMQGAEVVGKATVIGEVFGEPRSWPWSPCAHERSAKVAQSFWVFSIDACGVYGFDSLRLAHAGRSEPIGEIVLESRGKLRVRAGSGLLLSVLSNGEDNNETHADGRQPALSGSIGSATQP